MKRDASLDAMIFWLAFVSLSMSKIRLFPVWQIAAVSICGNERLTSNISLFCSAAFLDACSNIYSGIFLGLRGLFRDSSFLKQLVALLGGGCCFPRWLLLMLISRCRFPEFVWGPFGVFLLSWRILRHSSVAWFLLNRTF